jgi:3-isopropylmalate/(R)-2-methylmalate dehydratase small subunit
VLEDLDATFASKVQPGDILVAGKNFGSGSSREQAPIALQAAGIAAVVAGSFARIFYRNAVNIGLPVIEIKEHNIKAGHEIQVDLLAGLVSNLTDSASFEATRMPEQMVKILEAGGLVAYLKEHGDYV